MAAKPVIGVMGMTHLGLVSATAIASKGFRVHCYDADTQRIEALRAGCLSIEEPGLPDLLQANMKRQTFTDNLQDLKSCSVIYIACDVQTDEHNQSDLTSIRRLIAQAVDVLPESSTLVILSQVPPGFMRTLPVRPQQLYYQVETLVFGRAVERALHPERFIVGCFDPTLNFPKAYMQLLQSYACPLLPMRYESAELAKVAVNLFLAASVSTANTLAEISTAVGADWNEVIPALQLDQRIGHYAYLKPGLGLSGGNLERDLMTVIQKGEAHHTNVDVVKSWVENSHYQRDWVWRCLQQYVFTQYESPTIAIVGLSYKVNTNSIKNSPAIALLERLSEHHVKIHDPVVSHEAVSLGQRCDSVEETTRDADVLIVMTPWTEYKALRPHDLQHSMRGKWILDPYQALYHAALHDAGFYLLTLGKSWANPVWDNSVDCVS